jgi:galactosamine-6-phosphate isomerase
MENRLTPLRLQAGGTTFVVAGDAEEADAVAADAIATLIRKKPDSVICAASGATPTGAYRRLASMARDGILPTHRLTIVKLDEWIGMDLDDRRSCETYLRSEVLDPLSVPPERYVAIDVHADALGEACAATSRRIAEAGGIDIAIMGVGINGHLGLNEPADALSPFCHVADLTAETRRHPMIRDADPAIVRGVTLGMQEILTARHIVAIATGSRKAVPFRQFVERTVTTELPVSFLWLHTDALFVCDRAAAAKADLGLLRSGAYV